MASLVTEIIFILGLLILNGLLAMSEMALVSSRLVRLRQRADEGDAGAAVALKLLEQPNRFLSAVQVGITLVGILAGAFGGATIAEHLAAQFRKFESIAEYANVIAFAIVVVAITYFSLVIGELAPKRLALGNPERIAARVARPMRFLAWLTTPFVRLLSVSTELVIRLVGAKPSQEPPVTGEEIRLLMEQGAQAGVFEEAEHSMVKRALQLGDRRAAELMTPRPALVCLDLDDPPAVNWEKVKASPHTYFPVFQGHHDKIIGLASIKVLWAQLAANRPATLHEDLLKPLIVPESMDALTVLETFKKGNRHLALVIDEYGTLTGLITLTDIFEAIAGDIHPGDRPLPTRAVRREDGSWLLDGIIPVDELKEVLQLPELPGEADGTFQTLGGFVMAQLGRVPAVGDHFSCQGHRFEVVDMDDHRVDKVLAMAERKQAENTVNVSPPTA